MFSDGPVLFNEFQQYLPSTFRHEVDRHLKNMAFIHPVCTRESRTVIPGMVKCTRFRLIQPSTDAKLPPRSPPRRRMKIAQLEDVGSQVVQFSHFSVKELLTSDRLVTFSHREQCQLDWSMSTAGLVQSLCRSWRWSTTRSGGPCCWSENASGEVKEARELHVAQPLSSWWLCRL